MTKLRPVRTVRKAGKLRGQKYRKQESGELKARILNDAMRRLGTRVIIPEWNREYRLIMAPTEKTLKEWLEGFLNQEPFGKPIVLTLQKLQNEGVDPVQVLTAIHHDRFLDVPPKIPGWARSTRKLSKRAAALDRAAEILDEDSRFATPMFRDRGLDVYSTPVTGTRIRLEGNQTIAISHLRLRAKQMRSLKPLRRGPELIRITECTEGLFRLFVDRTGKPHLREVGNLVKATFPDWKAGNKSDSEYPLEGPIKRIWKNYRARRTNVSRGRKAQG